MEVGNWKEMSFKKRYAVKYYYIGSKKYRGSQRQAGILTIEEVILKTLLKKGYITSSLDSKLEFASRTDKHVSARGACFAFSSEKNLHLMEINSALPRDIGAWCFAEVHNGFSPRHDAVQRHYRYIIHNTQDNIAQINIDLLKKALKKLEGTHDFRNFCKSEAELKDLKTKRTIDLASIQCKDDFLVFDFKSKGFLRQQVRRMTKKVIEVGIGAINLEEFLNLFDSSKNITYQPADPKGLVLWDVNYGEKIRFQIDQKSLVRMNSYFECKKNLYQLKCELFSILQENDAGQ
ncbi:MAG: tRNA pseudouridine(38-40) synthase TruA [Candidatus Lokiarchaeota archaeon]|nr:tRNA pseudouridine(38-40) synthase TruA [Candidatus Lokiarchaeota archaeon]